MDSLSSSRFRGQRVHFIGIGGCGMSGLARILLDAGAIVTGSEPKPNQTTFALAQSGVKITREQMGELLSPQIDLVVRTAAVPEHNWEYLAARAYNLKQIKYAQLLGEIMQERLGVAVAGTHGKSTTTAMISYAMLQCGADPSFVVGGTVPQLGGGSRSGQGQAFVVEACEFDRSFHNLHPRVAVITNIEEDHLDCYKDIGEIVESFRRFASLVPKEGVILANGQDRRVFEAIGNMSTPIETVALRTKSTWSVSDIRIEDGCHCGHVSYKGTPVGTLRLSVPGEHNLFNATMAIAAANACGVDPGRAIEALATFKGVDRRMTEMGKCNGAIVVDDYGHHPTEIRATLRAIRERYAPRRLFCAFQPHQHSRTRFLLDDFAASFSDADEAIIADIYFVRDNDAERERVSSKDLVDRINSSGKRAQHLSDFAAIVRYLKEHAQEGDVVVTMGAGNVWEIGRDLVG